LAGLPKSPLIRIFPNPAQNVVQVNGLEAFPQISFQIYDMQGRIAAPMSMLNGNQIDVSKFVKGKYLVQFFAGNQQLGAKKLQIH